ncbi:hypothetical protein [Candidatus Azobacteroides pseudotrichonymphae]|uniref:Uncharacterized protein n=1 Tax=Azobacteroides pseudotrichonymphae genomovar. CFP2 TaxID=511995 RepID=B6YSA7_AZOPC|nr:hypothetical protein [Candidatus Azobacteroides pseudotrichonymphae]BAG84079.1 hypothetical protein CFPG_P2-21 [Candidatus Azobacteroides pseudotrichonymphae genomovar. CFP2]
MEIIKEKIMNAYVSAKTKKLLIPLLFFTICFGVKATAMGIISHWDSGLSKCKDYGEYSGKNGKKIYRTIYYDLELGYDYRLECKHEAPVYWKGVNDPNGIPPERYVYTTKTYYSGD